MPKKIKLFFMTSFFLCLLTTVISDIYAQQRMIDSLESIVNNDKLPDKDKIIPLARLGTAYIASTSDFEKALNSIKRATYLAKKQEDAKYATYSYSQLASLYSNLDSVALAYSAIDTCLSYMNKTKDINIKSDALLSLARAKLIWGDHDNVLDMLLQAYDLQKKDNTGPKLSPIYFMFYVYYSSSDLEKAKKYATLTLEESLKSKDYNAICRGWSALGAINYVTSDKDSRDSAMYAFRQAINVYEENYSAVEYSSYGLSLINLANIFFEKQNEKGSLLYPDSILYYAQKAKKIASEMDDIQLTARVIPLIANVQGIEGKVKDSERTLLNGLTFMTDKKGFYGEKKYLNKMLYLLYKEIGDYKNALIHKEEEAKFQNQINEQTYIREGKITEAKYRVKEKEHELTLSRQEAKRQKQLLVGSIISAVLLIILLLAFYRMRLRNIKHKAAIHKKEKEEIRLQALLKEKELQQSESEKKALELEKELEKEKAEKQALEINRLQTELIAGISHLEQKSDTIEKIKKAMEEKVKFDDKDLKDLLLTDKIADKSFEDFTELIQRVHPNFYAKLQEKAEQNLTALDLKYCTYIFMDFSSKEIANIMHVDPNTVRTTKYRLKQKLNLTKEDDLNIYIKTLLE